MMDTGTLLSLLAAGQSWPAEADGKTVMIFGTHFVEKKLTGRIFFRRRLENAWRAWKCLPTKPIMELTSQGDAFFVTNARWAKTERKFYGIIPDAISAAFRKIKYELRIDGETIFIDEEPVDNFTGIIVSWTHADETSKIQKADQQGQQSS